MFGALKKIDQIYKMRTRIKLDRRLFKYFSLKKKIKTNGTHLELTVKSFDVLTNVAPSIR